MTDAQIIRSLENFGDLAENAISETARNFWAGKRDALISQIENECKPNPKRRSTKSAK